MLEDELGEYDEGSSAILPEERRSRGTPLDGPAAAGTFLRKVRQRAAALHDFGLFCDGGPREAGPLGERSLPAFPESGSGISDCGLLEDERGEYDEGSSAILPEERRSRGTPLDGPAAAGTFLRKVRQRAAALHDFGLFCDGGPREAGPLGERSLPAFPEN